MTSYHMAVRVWPELRKAICLRANMDWRLYTMESIEVDDLDAIVTETIEFNAQCYGHAVRWRCTSEDRVAFDKYWAGRTYRQVLEEGTLRNPPRVVIQPANVIGPTTEETRADWKLFAMLCLDAWETTSDQDTETMVNFTEELRAALRRHRKTFVQLARLGTYYTPDERPYNLGIAYGWLAECADMAIALETTP
jgi:hypothetical protein